MSRAPTELATRNAEGLSQPVILPRNPLFFKASANDPPISPTPTMVTCSMRFMRLGDGASDGSCDQTCLLHQSGELLGTERLRSIAESLVGIRMYLDEQCVCTCGDGSARHWRNLVATSGSV